jgi:hypothetical protein
MPLNNQDYADLIHLSEGRPELQERLLDECNKRFTHYRVLYQNETGYDVLPNGAQIYIVNPNPKLGIKSGWSDVDWFGVPIAGTVTPGFGEVLFRIPISTFDWLMLNIHQFPILKHKAEQKGISLREVVTQAAEEMDRV